MRHSPLRETQQRLAGSGLHLAPALDGTWELPARYHHDAGAEYDAVRAPGGVGLRDRSWRGVLRLRGRDRLTFLQGMVSNDVASLTPGQSRRAALLDSTGHVLADLSVHVREDVALLETDPRCLPTLAQTLEKYLIMEKVMIEDVSDDWVTLSLQGSGAAQALPETLPEGAFAVAAAHSPEGGFDVWLPVASAPPVWEALVAGGAVPVGEEAAEVLRVEAGIAAWGRELTPAVLLPEAGLDDAVSYTKGCYVGQEIVARLHARGHTNRALRALVLEHSAPIPHSQATLHVPEDGPEPGREVGRLTSAVLSPAFNDRVLALGYVRREYWGDGTPLSVQILQPDGTVFSYAATVRTLPPLSE